MKSVIVMGTLLCGQSSLRGAKRRSNPAVLLGYGLLRFARNDDQIDVCDNTRLIDDDASAIIEA
jgi:hypothetical protein